MSVEAAKGLVSEQLRHLASKLARDAADYIDDSNIAEGKNSRKKSGEAIEDFEKAQKNFAAIQAILRKWDLPDPITKQLMTSAGINVDIPRGMNGSVAQVEEPTERRPRGRQNTETKGKTSDAVFVGEEDIKLYPEEFTPDLNNMPAQLLFVTLAVDSQGKKRFNNRPEVFGVLFGEALKGIENQGALALKRNRLRANWKNVAWGVVNQLDSQLPVGPHMSEALDQLRKMYPQYASAPNKDLADMIRNTLDLVRIQSSEKVNAQGSPHNNPEKKNAATENKGNNRGLTRDYIKFRFALNEDGSIQHTDLDIAKKLYSEGLPTDREMTSAEKTGLVTKVSALRWHVVNLLKGAEATRTLTAGNIAMLNLLDKACEADLRLASMSRQERIDLMHGKVPERFRMPVETPVDQVVPRKDQEVEQLDNSTFRDQDFYLLFGVLRRLDIQEMQVMGLGVQGNDRGVFVSWFSSLKTALGSPVFEEKALHRLVDLVKSLCLGQAKISPEAKIESWRSRRVFTILETANDLLTIEMLSERMIKQLKEDNVLSQSVNAGAPTAVMQESTPIATSAPIPVPASAAALEASVVPNVAANGHNGEKQEVVTIDPQNPRLSACASYWLVKAFCEVDGAELEKVGLRPLTFDQKSGLVAYVDSVDVSDKDQFLQKRLLKEEIRQIIKYGTNSGFANIFKANTEKAVQEVFSRISHLSGIGVDEQLARILSKIIEGSPLGPAQLTKWERNLMNSQSPVTV
jgi:hypothetical protein